jgi:hypothetical protein
LFRFAVRGTKDSELTSYFEACAVVLSISFCGSLLLLMNLSARASMGSIKTERDLD